MWNTSLGETTGVGSCTGVFVRRNFHVSLPSIAQFVPFDLCREMEEKIFGSICQTFRCC